MPRHPRLLLVPALVFAGIALSIAHQPTGLHVEGTEIELLLARDVAATLATRSLINPVGIDFDAIDPPPLPDQADLVSGTLLLDGIPVAGELLSMEKARAQYDSAVRAGEPAAILVRDVLGQLKLELAGIGQTKTVTVELIARNLVPASGGVEYRLLAEDPAFAAPWVTRTVVLTSEERHGVTLEGVGLTTTTRAPDEVGYVVAGALTTGPTEPLRFQVNRLEKLEKLDFDEIENLWSWVVTATDQAAIVDDQHTLVFVQ